MPRLIPLWVTAALCLSLIGCASSSDHGATVGVGDGGTVMPPPTGGACDTPNEGCDCETEGDVVDCGQVERVSGDYVSCSIGKRTCHKSKWRACIGDSVTTMNFPAGQQRTQALGTGVNCPDNPCDPYCRVVVDSPTGLTLPDGGGLSSDGGLQIVPRVSTGAGLCTSIVVKPTPQTVTVTGLTAAAPNGLNGEYFNNLDSDAPRIPMTWVPEATRVDPNLDFTWGNGTSPVPGISTQDYSVRWTGSITPPTSEAYALCAQTDDGTRMWLDDVLVIDEWHDSDSEEHCAPTQNWTANSVHAIRFELFNRTGGALAQLRWQTPTIAKQIVPGSAFTGTPPGLPVVDGVPQFQVEVSPPACFPGVPQPAWTLDRLDLGTIDAMGKVRLISPVAGQITVTAYMGNLSATGLLNVKVDIAETIGAPTGSVAAFGMTAMTADPGMVLYPYDQTVLPIGLIPPRIQWDPKGNAATAVKITLGYPATGAATFSWSKISTEATPAQAVIPSAVWRALEQTAKGNAAKLLVQRIVGGQTRLAMARSVTFSSSPVRGKIFYTEYHRGGAANEMVVDPGSENLAQPAFGTTNGCPACHTLSANGNVFATSSKTGYERGDQTSNQTTYSTLLGGISSVNANGTLTQKSDFVGLPSRTNYISGTKDWRGFAWAPLTPDGSYALVANNIWGNTEQNLIGIDGGTRRVNTGSVMQSGGSGTGLLAEYYPSNNFTGAVWKRLDPQVNFDIPLKPGGLLTNDFSVRRTGRIQAYFSETYKFEVVTNSGDTFPNLTVGANTGTGAAALNVAMTAGALVNFRLDQVNATGNSNVQLYWSSPSTPRALVPQTQLFPPAAEPLHGANVVYKDAGTATAALIEPDVASNWGNHAPLPAFAADGWMSTWDTQVESPYTGAVDLCVDAANGVQLSVGGLPLINSATSSTNFYSNCVAAGNWTLGTKYTVHIVQQDVLDSGVTGTNPDKAYLILKYRYNGVTEVIPSTNLYPVTATLPTSGLTATYYDIDGFNSSLTATQTNPRAFQRVDPNIDFDWDQGRPNYSTISADDAYSARWTGHIVLPCSGVYQFQTNGNVDDGGRLWIDSQRIMARWGYGALSGAAFLQMGTHDFKFDWYENGGAAVARLMWKTPCAGSPGWVAIPQGSFTPNSGYARNTGFLVDGGDNGNNTSYWIWQTATSSTNPTPLDVTGTDGNWGLAGTSMMVPAFAPDASKLVFVDGDSGDGAGWRKGLSVFDFDQTTKLFKNRRLVTSTWPLGDAIKWPTFESDSRSVIYQTTFPGDACCRKSTAPLWTQYGFMGPTNYYEDPGRLWSIDTQAATPTPVELTKLNHGEQATDHNKSYQPTMLPVASGGYRWVVFTSTRPYGNTLNLSGIQKDFSNTASYADASFASMQNYQDIQSQLWVAAIDDSPSGGIDRSHPAFWLPSQNFSTNASTGYVNERGYWTLDACHPPGVTTESLCEVDDDCCGGNAMPKAAACRLDTPVANPAMRHCQALPANGGCANSAQSCGSTTDCCTGLVCVGAACIAPPAVVSYGYENWERIYQSDCPDGTKVVWRFFDWQTVTPATGSRLEIFAETQADQTMFSTLAPAPSLISVPGVVAVWTISGAPVTNWTGKAVDPLLDAQMLKSQQYLKITVRFVPNDEGNASPVLKNWRQSYSCDPAE